MGWERKRGKLHELNRLLRGRDRHDLPPVGGRPRRRSPRACATSSRSTPTRGCRADAASRLVGTMAHPLNRPRFDPTGGRVVDGYAILQPRVTPPLPTERDGSLFQRLFVRSGGHRSVRRRPSPTSTRTCSARAPTPARASTTSTPSSRRSAAAAPENALLSHDLFEGIFARAGLVTDIELFEEFPSHYEVAAARQHRWARGDWQLLPWIFAPRPAAPCRSAAGR